MQIKSIILLTATLAFAACSDDVTHGDKFTVGDADNAINLSIGVQSSPTALQSRALAGHYAMQENTAINLYVEGDWTHSGTTTNIVKKSTYRAVKDDDADNINAIKWKSREHLYWDDFGTADPDNTANRAKGLGILAVAIDGIEGTSIVNLGGLIDWDSFTVACDLESNKGTFEVVGGKKFLRQDILIANNLYDEADVTSPQKRYTFDEQKGSDPAESRLDFKHVLSKITFNITAGNGFNGIFSYEPNITLTRNKTGESNAEWCYKKGSIDIKTATATHDSSDPGTVELNTITSSSGNFTESAVIYPGSNFGSDNDIIARINADFNIYYVTAAQIRAAINALGASHEHSGNYTTLAGYHYIFNVTLNKTDIVVTATITDWNTVEAATEIPEILPMATITWDTGGGTAADLKEFEFYSSTSKDSNYEDLATAKCSAGADGSTKWTFYDVGDVVTKLYWPSHDTHLFFRGVSPKSTTITNNREIAISNIQYTSGNSASNLLIGMPEITSGTMCDNPDHTHVDMSAYGICARKEPINLNFRYMMSQVEVHLATTTGDDAVAIGENTVVQLEKIYSSGIVALGTRQVSVSGSTGIYTLDKDVVETDADKQKLQRRSAIVPQSIGDDVRFKITVTNADTSTDVYYAQVNQIKENGTSSYITEWEAGKHYIYTLTLKKTGLSVTATITDWTTITGSDEIWF